MNNVADPVIMAIKPRFAKLIYEGRKVWEFRKTPPPLMRLVLVYTIGARNLRLPRGTSEPKAM